MRNLRRFTGAARAEIWDRIASGVSVLAIAASFGRYRSAIRAVQLATGGARPRERTRSSRSLSLVEQFMAAWCSCGRSFGPRYRCRRHWLHREAGEVPPGEPHSHRGAI